MTVIGPVATKLRQRNKGGKLGFDFHGGVNRLREVDRSFWLISDAFPLIYWTVSDNILTKCQVLELITAEAQLILISAAFDRFFGYCCWLTEMPANTTLHHHNS